MPMPRLNTRAISSSATSPSRWISAKTRGASHAATIELGVDALGQHPGQVAGEPAAGDVGDGAHVDVAEERPHGRGVDHRRREQLVGEAVVRARERGVVEGQPGALEQHPAGQRVAVGAQSGRRQPDEHVAGPGARRP